MYAACQTFLDCFISFTFSAHTKNLIFIEFVVFKNLKIHKNFVANKEKYKNRFTINMYWHFVIGYKYKCKSFDNKKRNSDKNIYLSQIQTYKYWNVI